jgi:hypothetical protein
MSEIHIADTPMRYAAASVVVSSSADGTARPVARKLHHWQCQVRRCQRAADRRRNHLADLVAVARQGSQNATGKAGDHDRRLDAERIEELVYHGLHPHHLAPFPL